MRVEQPLAFTFYSDRQERRRQPLAAAEIAKAAQSTFKTTACTGSSHVRSKVQQRGWTLADLAKAHSESVGGPDLSAAFGLSANNHGSVGLGALPRAVHAWRLPGALFCARRSVSSPVRPVGSSIGNSSFT